MIVGNVRLYHIFSAKLDTLRFEGEFLGWSQDHVTNLGLFETTLETVHYITCPTTTLANTGVEISNPWCTSTVVQF